jgi:hypothetical protein
MPIPQIVMNTYLEFCQINFWFGDLNIKYRKIIPLINELNEPAEKYPPFSKMEGCNAGIRLKEIEVTCLDLFQYLQKINKFNLQFDFMNHLKSLWQGEGHRYAAALEQIVFRMNQRVTPRRSDLSSPSSRSVFHPPALSADLFRTAASPPVLFPPFPEAVARAPLSASSYFGAAEPAVFTSALDFSQPIGFSADSIFKRRVVIQKVGESELQLTLYNENCFKWLRAELNGILGDAIVGGRKNDGSEFYIKINSCKTENDPGVFLLFSRRKWIAGYCEGAHYNLLSTVQYSVFCVQFDNIKADAVAVFNWLIGLNEEHVVNKTRYLIFKSFRNSHQGWPTNSESITTYLPEF